MERTQSDPRPWVLHEANYRQLLDVRPSVALLPWGATEAHNYHLPHGTDVIEANEVAIAAAGIAKTGGTNPIVLPPIPFGNNAQQLDQVCTIHLSTFTAAAILRDVVKSLHAQQITRLMIINAHGGNEFKPIVRDLMHELGGTILVVDFWRMIPDQIKAMFKDAGDHAGELETSLLLHLCPDWVKLNQAGEGRSEPFNHPALKQVGVWTPRLWSKMQPDTGAGDPRPATAEKGKQYFEAVIAALAMIINDFARASDNSLP